MLAMSFAKSASRAIEKEIDGHARKIEKASIRALNKTVRTGRTAASKIIRKTVNVKAKAVNKSLKIERAKKGKPVARIQSTYKAIPVIEFSGVRQTKKGVSVRMRKDMPRKLFRGAFIATMKSGHKGVFRRLGKQYLKRWSPGRKQTRGTENLPIKELYGPPVHNIFGDKINEIIRVSDGVLEKNLDHEIKFELSKK